jgi:hypothetical protein
MDTAKQLEETKTLKLLLDLLQNTEGADYIVKTRPETDDGEPGTYDFLCISQSCESEGLRVEIIRFMQGHRRKAFQLAIEGVAFNLPPELRTGLPGSFDLQIVGPPVRSEIILNPSGRYLGVKKEKVSLTDLKRHREPMRKQLAAEIREHALDPDFDFQVGDQYIIHQPFDFDLIKRSDQGHSLTVEIDYYDPDPTLPRNLAGDGFRPYLDRSLKLILAKKNQQLHTAKASRWRTALIINVDMEDPVAGIYCTAQNLKTAINAQPASSWSSIDRIYVRTRDSINLIASQ